MPELKGIITPTITPISKGDLDYDAVDALIEFLHKSGVNGIFPMGSTGAFSITSAELELKILEYFMDKKKEGMYFLAGVGRNSYDETLAMANYAKELGADGLSIVTPYYVNMNQESLFRFYDKILGQLDIQVLIYNIPQNTNNSISPNTVARLRKEHSNLVGIKDSSGNFSNFSQFVDLLGEGFRILQGQDDLLFPSLSIGASGGICGTSNFSSLAVNVYKEFSNGNIQEARKLQKKLTSLKKIMGGYPFPQAYISAFSNLIMKREVQSIFPLVDLPENERDKLTREIESALNVTEI